MPKITLSHNAPCCMPATGEMISAPSLSGGNVAVTSHFEAHKGFHPEPKYLSRFFLRLALVYSGSVKLAAQLRFHFLSPPEVSDRNTSKRSLNSHCRDVKKK